MLGRQWMLFATCGMLDAAARGGSPLVLRAALDRLADHFDSAPDRARRGMGACPGELREVERRSRLTPRRTRVVAAIAHDSITIARAP